MCQDSNEFFFIKLNYNIDKTKIKTQGLRLKTSIRGSHKSLLYTGIEPATRPQQSNGYATELIKYARLM